MTVTSSSPMVMAFASPAHAKNATVPTLDFAGGWFGTVAAAPALHGQTVTRGYLGAATDLLTREAHRGVSMMVTLQAG